MFGADVRLNILKLHATLNSIVPVLFLYFTCTAAYFRRKWRPSANLIKISIRQNYGFTAFISIQWNIIEFYNVSKKKELWWNVFRKSSFWTLCDVSVWTFSVSVKWYTKLLFMEEVLSITHPLLRVRLC